MNQSISGNGISMASSSGSNESVVKIDDIKIVVMGNKLSIVTPEKDLDIEVNGIKYEPIDKSK